MPNARAIGAVYTERVMNSIGMSIADVNPVSMGFPDMLAALATGAVDGAWLIEPTLTSAVARGIARPVITLGDVFAGAPSSMVVFGPAFAADQDAARRYVIATLRGMRDYHRATTIDQAEKENLIPILTKYTSVKDPAVLRSIGWPVVDPNGAINLSFLNEAQEFYLRIGSQQERVDFTKIHDPAFVEYALQQLGRMN
jgi:NitT/TauT family transport system substrate-binding protein